MCLDSLFLGVSRNYKLSARNRHLKVKVKVIAIEDRLTVNDREKSNYSNFSFKSVDTLSYFSFVK